LRSFLKDAETISYNLPEYPDISGEPTSQNQQPFDNKSLKKNENPVLSIGLDKILQKCPELALVVEHRPDLPEHIKAAIKVFINSSNGRENK
jgi:hypothetical protein